MLVWSGIPTNDRPVIDISGIYTTGNTIGDTKSDSTTMTAGAAWVAELSIAHTEGNSHEISRPESYSRQYTLSVSPGSSGYLIFTPSTPAERASSRATIAARPRSRRATMSGASPR
ncbi:uncharacterized protein PG986_004641 [Apiospora aurea]|uniref:Uncharacterized protein n=1 Tax=Apiospora aurea TaxID=335848 RepID=A0ABR1QNN7_9PEZI